MTDSINYPTVVYVSKDRKKELANDLTSILSDAPAPGPAWIYDFVGHKAKTSSRHCWILSGIGPGDKAGAKTAFLSRAAAEGFLTIEMFSVERQDTNGNIIDIFYRPGVRK